jgi:Rab-GTPase-TBC domain
VDGIPSAIRGPIWCLLCDYASDEKNHNKDLYQKLLDMENPSQEYMIKKDIYRTLPDTKLFTADYKEGTNKLFNVLKAYTCYDNKIGYVQGMNYLAAIMLIEIGDEVKVFWCLFSLLFKRNWRMIYDHNTPKLLNLL